MHSLLATWKVMKPEAAICGSHNHPLSHRQIRYVQSNAPNRRIHLTASQTMSAKLDLSDIFDWERYCKDYDEDKVQWTGRR